MSLLYGFQGSKKKAKPSKLNINQRMCVDYIRFFIEAFRTDSLYVFGLKTAQLVSIVFVIVGLIGFIYCHIKEIGRASCRERV